MLKRFRRIVINDDSDDDDVVPCASATNDETASLTDDNSHSLTEIGATESRKGDSSAPKNEANEYYTSDDSYVEDSFLVKDSSDNENWDQSEISSSFSDCIPSPEAQKLFPFSMSLRSSVRKVQKTSSNYPSRLPRSKRLSKDLFSDRTNLSLTSESSEESNKLSDSSKTNVSIDEKNCTPSEHGNSPEKSLYDSEESFEAYIRKTKEELRKANEQTFSKRDMKNFVVSDDESIEVITDSGEEVNEVSEEEYGNSGQDDDSINSDDGIFSRSSDKINSRGRSTKLEAGDGKNANSQKKLVNDQKEHSDNSFDKRLIFELFCKERESNAEALSLSPKEIKQVEIFLLALSGDVKGSHCCAGKYVTAKFTSIREELTKLLFRIYETTCFEGKFGNDIKILWNPRLLKTAGRCLYLKNSTAKIELSVKVCNKPDRVRDTLLHELCHAAVFLIDKVLFGRHGPVWQKWARKCMDVFPRIPVIQRCHCYSIDAKYHYICSVCGQVIKRHSKSLDLKRYRCGVCTGNFVLHNARGKRLEQTVVRSNPFARYVKENYGKYRRDGKKHAEVMKLLSEQFKQLSCATTHEKESGVFNDVGRSDEV